MTARMLLALHAIFIAGVVNAATAEPDPSDGEAESSAAATAAQDEFEPVPVIPVAGVAEDGPDAPAEVEPPVQFDAITVTATRTARWTFDVPESVSVISRSRIESQQPASLGDVLQGLPGVDIAGGPRPDGESINVRGLGGTRVLLNVDGARQNFDGAHRSRLLVDPDLLKSLEILRGPASALWGSDALGGVVSLTTKAAADFLRPGENLGARLKLGYDGADDGRARSGTVFGRFGSLDFLADRGTRESDDLTQAADQTLPYSALATQGGLYKLTNFFGAASELSASLQTYSDQGLSPSNPALDVTEDNPLLQRHNRQQYLTARYSYRTPEPGNRVSGANLTLYRSGLEIVEDRVISPRHDTLDFATTGGSVQTSLRLPAWDALLTFGGESYADRSEAQRDGQPRPQFPDARRTINGAFVQNEFQHGAWSLMPGLRWDRFQSRSNTDAASAVDDQAVSRKLGLSYALSDALSLNALYGEAFRAPSLLETYAQGQHFLGNEFRPNPDLQPERARNFELGFSYRSGALFAVNDQWLLKLSVYDNRVRDYIETVVVVETQGPFPPPAQCVQPQPAAGCINRDENGLADPTLPPIYVGGYTTSENLPQARIRGAELVSAYEWGPATLQAGYSLIRGMNQDSGAALLSIPADALHLDAGVRFNSIRLGVRGTHAFDQNRVPLNTDGTPVIPRTPAYTVANLYAGWTPARLLQGFKLTLGVDNLADAAYRPHLSNYLQAGRSLRAALAYQF